MTVRMLTAIGLAGLLALAPTCGHAQSARGLFDTAKSAVVKIRVEGFDPNNRPKAAEEGSGVVVFSKRGITLVVTAAHVIGSSQSLQQLNPDWLVNDLDRTIRRTIRIFAFNQNGVLTEVAASASVIGHDEQRDIAALSFAGTFPTLQVSTSFDRLMSDPTDALALGFEKGSSIVSFNSGKGKIEPSQRFGFGFVMDTRVDEGRSGGPIMNVQDGKVVAIASRNIGSGARHEGSPITFAVPLLTEFYRSIGEEDAPQTAATFRRSGKASVRVAGFGGSLATPRSQEAGLDNWADARGQGGERSECREGSGRTISDARARAQVSSFQEDGLRFEYETRAQGGHYRTASGCVAGNPVGLTGHDTESSAQASLQGEIHFSVARNGQVQVVWSGMPPHAKYKLSKVDEDVKEVEMQGNGSKTFSAEAGKTYRLTVTMDEFLSNRGACCPQEKTSDARIRVTR
jgi:hypothetical protein